MLSKFITNSFIGRYIYRGHPRSQKLKKNIGAAFILKAISIILSLIRVPILLSYLDPEKYGVWLTISSIVMWVEHFNLGLGHGLRNRFAEAIAQKDIERAKGLVSTTYISLSAIMFIIMILLIPIIRILNWNIILNVQTIPNSELIHSILFVLVMFILRFVFILITVILKADQRPAISDAYLPISSFISLILVLILRMLVPDSLFLACVIIAAPHSLVLLIANFYFFKKQYHQYKPSLKLFRKKYLKDIYSLGIKFFVGQIVGLILFSSSNIILANVINPEEVTVFNIAKRYFSLPLMFYLIILVPYWSAITDAYIRGELHWIRSNMQKLFKVAFLFSLVIIIMLLISPYAFKLWIGDRVVIPFKLSLIYALYNIGVMFLSPFTHFIKGVGKLSLGVRIAPFKAVIFLPAAILLSSKFGAMGLVGALLIINLLPNLFIEIMQYKKIINRKAHGIWNR